MRSNMSHSGRQQHYTIRGAAWILGVDRSRLSRLIRLGELRTTARNGRPVIPARELARHLGQPSSSDSQNGGRA